MLQSLLLLPLLLFSYRPQQKEAEAIEDLKAIGADIVVSESYLRTPEMRRLISDLPKPGLGLNATGGKAVTDMARLMGVGSTLVTYGGMSRQPVTIPTSLLLFHDLTLKGFWLKRSLQDYNREARSSDFKQIAQMIKSKKLKLLFERFSFAKFEDALQKSLTPMHQRKVILRFDDESNWK